MRDALILLYLHVVSHSNMNHWLGFSYQHNVAHMSSLTSIFLSCSLLGLSIAKRKFAESLNEFKFQCIGDAETDDEICIGE